MTLKYLRALLCVLLLPAFNLSAQEASSRLGTTTTPPYAVGDYYNEQGLEGVVFEVDESGTSGKILSLAESKGVRQWGTIGKGNKRFIGADSMDDGAYNMEIVRQFDNWREYYPAFAWCSSLGEDWYLPAIQELKAFAYDHPIYTVVNNTLKSLGTTPLPNKGDWVDYWSSTDRKLQSESQPECFAWSLNMKNGLSKDMGKSRYCKIRAVARFPKMPDSLRRAAIVIPPESPLAPTQPPYKAGDYYNEAGRKGVVFHVDATGHHGLIVSIAQSSNDIIWATAEAKLNIIGAFNKEDGRENLKVVMQIEDWQRLYPAFAWCVERGQGWYLPAVEELKLLLGNAEVHAAVNKTLDEHYAPLLHPLGQWKDYWTSTEAPKIEVKYDEATEEYEAEPTTDAYGYFLFNSSFNRTTKESDLTVRAIARF